jgi:hypothetical protein
VVSGAAAGKNDDAGGEHDEASKRREGTHGLSGYIMKI